MLNELSSKILVNYVKKRNKSLYQMHDQETSRKHKKGLVKAIQKIVKNPDGKSELENSKKLKSESIEVGQAVIKHEPPTDSSISITNPKIRSEINYRFGNELKDLILSPVDGIQKVRKVLHRFGLDIPALYDLDHDGDEVVLEMNQFGILTYDHDNDEDDETYYLYLLYCLTDNGTYDFHAEITDEDGIEEIMKEEDIE
jgi:hypothetical protein